LVLCRGKTQSMQSRHSIGFAEQVLNFLNQKPEKYDELYQESISRWCARYADRISRCTNERPLCGYSPVYNRSFDDESTEIC